jgi:hypothetical protein
MQNPYPAQLQDTVIAAEEFLLEDGFVSRMDRTGRIHGTGLSGGEGFSEIIP